MSAGKGVEPYDHGYADWKDWGGESFGQLSHRDKLYYECELKRAGIWLTPGARVLEVGFGNGSFMAFGRSQGWSMVGTELIPELYRCARGQGYDVHLAADLSGFETNSFDAVFAFDVVEHVPGDELVTFFQQVKRVCRPGAKFMLRVPNGDSPFGLVNQNGDVTHVSAIGRNKMIYLASSSGAREIHYGGEYVPVRDPVRRVAVSRFLATPIKKAINIFVQCTMFPEMRIDFCARNVVFVLDMQPQDAS